MTDTPIQPTWRTRELLALLLDHDDGIHGYGIAQTTGRPAPSVYVTLKRLAADGWVESWIDTSGQRPRRMYRLTLLGHLHARRILDDTPEETA